MPGRLEEMADATRARFERWLRAVARRVVVYAYGDWLPLRPLVERAFGGRAGLASLVAAPGAEAGLLEWR
jgi:hypothetical protein